MASALNDYLQKRGKTKARRRTQDLLGYTIEALRDHLERLFLPGMTWDNYGEWQIDHIRPLRLCQATAPTDRDFKQFWALTNLQPLWKEDNLRKGSKVLIDKEKSSGT